MFLYGYAVFEIMQCSKLRFYFVRHSGAHRAHNSEKRVPVDGNVRALNFEHWYDINRTIRGYIDTFYSENSPQLKFIERQLSLSSPTVHSALIYNQYWLFSTL